MSGEADLNLFEALLALETRLMDPAFRRDKERVSMLLREDFCEFGASGRLWTRETILDMMVSEEAYTPPRLEGFSVKRLGPDAALVTYRAVREATADVARRETWRSSLWIQGEDAWRLAFHQGTIVLNA